MRGLLICLFVALAAPAFADTTADYAAPSGAITMTIEIAANGDLRGNIRGRSGDYLLMRNGQGYFVVSTPNGLFVDRVEDQVAALKIVAERHPVFLARMKAVGVPAGHFLGKGDDIVVQGRKGTPYYFGGRPRFGLPPILVISSDAELAPLGVAMERLNVMFDSLQSFAGGDPVNLEMETIMKSGAPVAVTGAELTRISHDPIPSSRFELPAAPESRDDIIKRIDATATSQSVRAF